LLIKLDIIGHIHGDELVDIPFPAKIRDALVAAGRAHLYISLTKDITLPLQPTS